MASRRTERRAERDGARRAARLLAMSMLGLALSMPQPAEAGSSAWQGQKQAKARLVTGLVEDRGARRLLAGLHIRLEESWKTYWRHPGEAGMPPSADWAGSSNLASARVLYPAPRRIPDAGFESIGYVREVLLPVEIVAKEAGRPIELAVAFEFGACKDICVPIEVKLAARADETMAEGALIAAWFARVPRPDASGTDVPRIVAVRSEATARPPSLLIDVDWGSADSKGADLFIETADGGLAPLPKMNAAGPPMRFRSVLGSPEELARLVGTTLRLTLVGAGGGWERLVRVP